ncbi:glycosyltransferase [Pseudomonas sp. 3A(2025)]
MISHFGVVPSAWYSHFQAFQALATTLLDRGHRVTFFQQADTRAWLSDPRIEFCALGTASHPPGSLAANLKRAARPGLPFGLRRIIDDMAASTAMLAAELPGALQQCRVDALLCDQMEASGGLVAEALGLPFVSVACALPINREPQLPLPVMPFAYGQDERSLRMYEGSRQVHDWLMRPLRRTLHDAARRLGVAPRDGLHDCLSPLAQISQTLSGFDFPRLAQPAHFHPVGPLRAGVNDTCGTWPIKDQRPLVFASLGTLQGDRLGMFKRMAIACRHLDTQLLIAHCGALDTAQETFLLRHGATWVTDFAPQRWALEQADAVITHGGLNTVMDAIAAQTPMLVMPIAFDQPGVAARVSYSGVGVQLNRRAGAARIARRLTDLLARPREPLQRLAAELQQAGGVSRAADIVEQAIRTGQPVIVEEAGT